MTRPEPRTPEYAGGQPRLTREFEVFLSSGSDVEKQRELFKQLAAVFNDQARDAGVDYRIGVRAWEEAVSRRTYGDGNREFRYDAAISNLVIVLLHRELRRGTEEEIDWALSSPEVQIAVIWMDPPPENTRKQKERKLLTKMNQIKDEVRWSRTTEHPDHIATAIEMVKILARLLIHIASPPPPQQANGYTEVR